MTSTGRSPRSCNASETGTSRTTGDRDSYLSDFEVNLYHLCHHFINMPFYQIFPAPPGVHGYPDCHAWTSCPLPALVSLPGQMRGGLLLPTPRTSSTSSSETSLSCLFLDVHVPRAAPLGLHAHLTQLPRSAVLASSTACGNDRLTRVCNGCRRLASMYLLPTCTWLSGI